MPERKSMVHRPLRKAALPLLTFAPVLTLAVMNPGVAFADDATPQEDSIPQGILTICDDPFSSGGASAFSGASDSSPNYSIDTYVDSSANNSGANSGDGASQQNANQVPTSSNSPSYSYDLAQNSGSDSYMIAENSGPGKSPNSISNTVNALFTNSDKGSFNSGNRSLLSAAGLNTQNSIPIDDPSGANAPSGVISIYDPHQALLTFTVTKGGTIAQDAKTSVSAGEGVEIVSQSYENSLMGNSPTVTAVPDAGYHFVHWLDMSTGKPLSTSVTFTPDRPAWGWPENWIIQAVFALDVYQILLDPNGGVSIGGGGGGGSGGTIYLGEVVPGSEFQLPDNGTEDLSVAKAGCVFNGWNAVAHPDSETASGFVVSDGQMIDEDTEKLLEDQGYLITGKNIPTLILYAQWIANQVAIEYATASSGGTVSLYTERKGSGASYTKETLMADSGIHPDKDVSAGPEGAVAIANTGHHFTGWSVSGTEQELSVSESTNANLTSAAVSRVSYYPDTVPNIGEYHSASFAASFAPNTYEVMYDSNGGEGYADSEKYTYGQGSITAASTGMTRDGYTLSGWNLSPNGGSVTIPLGSTIDSNTINTMIASGLVADKDAARAKLYAMWTSNGSSDPNGNGNGNDNGSSEPSNNPSGDPSPGPASEPSSAGEVISRIIDSGISNGSRAAADAIANADSTASGVTGLFASTNKSDAAASAAGPLIVNATYSDMAGSGVAGYGNDNSILSSLMSPEGLQEAGTTVAAVAAVGALASLVGVGVSVAGAALVGAATIGTASAVGLSSAADLAADLAVASAAGAAGAAKKRKRREEDDSEEEPETQE